jgi:hypothetical protein
MFKKRFKKYVSPVDLFLDNLRKTIPENDTQQRERKQYEELNALRDNPNAARKKESLWEEF